MPESPINDILQNTEPVKVKPKPKPKPKPKKPKQAGESRLAANTSGKTTPKGVARKRRRPRKPADQRWTHGKQRYNFYLETQTKEAAEDRVWNGASPHPYLSGTVNELLQNWVDGLYDDIHAEQGNWPDQNQDS